MKSEKNKRTPMSSNILRIFAGVYLLYTAYQLCMPVINGAPDAELKFLFIGIAFGIAGLFFAGLGLKGAAQEDKKRKAELAETTVVEASADEEENALEEVTVEEAIASDDNQ